MCSCEDAPCCGCGDDVQSTDAYAFYCDMCGYCHVGSCDDDYEDDDDD